MKERRLQILLVLAMLILVTASSFSAAQSRAGFTGPGIHWEFPEEHHLFLAGTEDEPLILRNWPTVTGIPLGSAGFSKTSSTFSQNLVTLESAPVTEALLFEGNLTVNLYASLEAKSPICRQTNVVPGTPAGATTTFAVSLSWGGFSILDSADTNSVTMEESYTNAHHFSVEARDINVSLGPGDTFALSIDVRHDCVQSGVLWWGTFDARSGITLDGDLVDPQMALVIDSNRMARIEFTPISPWGGDDFSGQVLEIVGPTDDWDSMIHGFGQEDERIEHFETPHSYRIGEANRSVRTWSAEKPLESGKYMVDACFTLSDQNPVDLCDIIAVLRFEVPEDPAVLLNSTWVAILIPLGVLVWLGAAIKEAMLPLPAYAVILVLALAAIGPAMSLPDIEANQPRIDGAAPAFALLEHGGDGSVSLADLLSESDAVVVGMFVPGSPNALRQANDFEMASSLIGTGASFVQIATGKGVNAVDLDVHAAMLNESWPLLMDRFDSSVGRAFPSGASDAVIIIDAGGFVTTWQPGTLSSTEIAEAVKDASRGSGHTIFTPINLLWGTALLPLFVLAMPRERRYEEPDEPLVPGAGVLLTLLGAGAGFALWALPIALLSALGAGTFWIWIEVVLAALLAYHGIRTLLDGRIFSIDKISGLIHSRLPESYRVWRPAASFSDDVHLGLWVAWLIWLNTPDLVAQGVGSVARTSAFGVILAMAMLAGLILAAGLTVVFARLVIGITGPIPRTLGSLSVGIRPRAWGLASAIMGGWLLVSLVVGPVLGSL